MQEETHEELRAVIQSNEGLARGGPTQAGKALVQQLWSVTNVSLMLVFAEYIGWVGSVNLWKNRNLE